MPELPEVETVRRDLEKAVVGRVIETALVTGKRSIRRQDPRSFCQMVAGKRVGKVERRGKYLVLRLAEETDLVVHLRMSGQLRLVGKDEPLDKHTHVRLLLDRADELRFVDPRTFGELFVAKGRDPLGRPQELAALGIDPVADGLSVDELALLCHRRKALKSFLLDQHLLAGIGSIYADEICFRAGLRPDRETKGLSRREVLGLHGGIETVLVQAIDSAGSSLADARYTDLFGRPGRFQELHFVYARYGEPCLICGKKIERRRVGGRYAHFCPRCQH